MTRYIMPFLALLGVALGSSLRGDEGPDGASPSLGACFAGFSTLPPGASPDELILRTYRELLDSAGAKLSPAELEVAIEGKNPLRFAENGSQDLLSFNRHLKELDKMLEAHGWFTETVRTAMLKELRTLASGKRRAAETNEGKAVAAENSYDVELDYVVGKPSFHPDGRYVLLPEPSLDVELNKGAIHTNVPVLDLQTRQVTKQTTGIDRFSAGTFLPNGNVVFAGAGQTLTVVPFRDGKFDFENSRRMGRPLKPVTAKRVSQFDRIHVSRDGRMALAFAGGTDFFHFDLTTGRRTRIDVGTIKRDVLTSIDDFGVVPGTDRVYFLTATEPNRFWMREFTVKKNGQLEPYGRDFILRYPVHNISTGVRMDSSGTRFAFSQGHQLILVDRATGRETPLNLPRLVADSLHQITDLTFHPTLPLLLVTLDDFTTQTRSLEVVDLTRNEARPIDPARAKAEFLAISPDGKRVVFSPRYGQKIRVMNLEESLEKE